MGAYSSIPYNPPDPVENYTRALQIKGLMQQQQLQQEEMRQRQMQTQLMQQQRRDQAVFRDAWQNNDDWDSALRYMRKNGASANMLVNVEKARLDTREKALQTDKTQHELDSAHGDWVVGQLDHLMQLPAEQRAAQLPAIQQQHAQLFPRYAAQFPQQVPTDDASLTMMRNLQMAHTQDIAAAKEKRAAEEHEATLPGKRAESLIKGAEAAALQQGGMTQQMADMKYRQLLQQQKAGQPISQDDENFMAAYKEQKLMVPVATTNLRLAGYEQARGTWAYDQKNRRTVWTSAEELNRARSEEPGRYTEPSYTPEAIGGKASTEYFIKGKGGQQLTAFNTAIAHLNTLQRLAGDLQNTDIQIVNRAKQQWAQQTGSPAPANFAAAKNAMAGEVAAALKASGATDQEIAKVDSTFSRAQSTPQLNGAISTYRELLYGKRDNLYRQWQAGMQGQPAFEQAQPIYARNPQTRHRIVSYDGGQTWQPAQ